MLNFISSISEKKKKVIIYILFAIGIFAITYLIYQQYAYLLGRKTVNMTYWDLLARSFLEGKLYLKNPIDTYDLTFYQGHWYVPQPPLPAILLLPWVILNKNASTILFSIFFSAINTMLLFVILDQLSRLGWIKTSKAGILWLVVLFAFGTPHWWVGMDGKVWFVSQIVTVTFVALAILLALKSYSPWLVGICLGLAIFSRPNVIVIWPFLFAIKWEIMKDENKDRQKQLGLSWTIKSMIPIGLFIFGLLSYNYLRFHNFFDFGYATINGDPDLVGSVQKYGMFSIHFIPRNLNIMFLKLPAIHPEIPYIAPSKVGMSIFITTPAFLYLIHRYEKRIWIIGAWISVILSLVFLSMYSNSGWAQFGYRYVLDFIIPLMILMAVALKEKTSRSIIPLIIISIVVNEFGAFWFINYLGG
jgi:hypothetical protein